MLTAPELEHVVGAPPEAGVAGEDGAAGAGPGDDAGDVPGAVADQWRASLARVVTTISPHSPVRHRRQGLRVDDLQDIVVPQ